MVSISYQEETIFNLPSKSSEFLMVNDIAPASDGSIVMDQNYWYPYGLFSLYALRVFRWIGQRASNAGFALILQFATSMASGSSRQSAPSILMT